MTTWSRHHRVGVMTRTESTHVGQGMDAALQQQATGVEVVTDFAPKAIARRRRNYRNRMALVATACVAAVAVAVPTFWAVGRRDLDPGPARPTASTSQLRSTPPPPACPRRFPPRGPPPRRRHRHNVVGAVRAGHVKTPRDAARRRGRSTSWVTTCSSPATTTHHRGTSRPAAPRRCPRAWSRSCRLRIGPPSSTRTCPTASFSSARSATAAPTCSPHSKPGGQPRYVVESPSSD